MNDIWKITTIGTALLAGHYAAQANRRTKQLKTAVAALDAAAQMSLYLADVLDKNEVPLTDFDEIAIHDLANME